MIIFSIIQKAVKITKELRGRLAKLFVIVTVLNITFGTAFYYAERSTQEGLTYLDSIWWSMVTMTTVGYGDYFAQTFIGRFVVSIPIFIVGIGTLGYLLGEIANIIIENQSKRKRGMNEVTSIEHIIFCNFPGVDKTLSLIEEIKGNEQYAKSHFVIVTDTFDEIPDTLAEKKVRFVKGSPTDKEALVKANVEHCSGVIVLPSDPNNAESDNKSYVIASLLKQIKLDSGASFKVILEAVSNKNMAMMNSLGTDGIVTKEGISDRLLVQEFLNPGLHDVFQQVISNLTGSQLYLKDTKLVGFKISDIQIAVLTHPANIQVIGLIRDTEKILNPAKDTVIETGDQLVLLADREEDFASIEQDILSGIV